MLCDEFNQCRETEPIFSRVVPFAIVNDKYRNYAVKQRVTINIDGWQWREATGSFAAIICKMIRQEMAVTMK